MARVGGEHNVVTGKKTWFWVYNFCFLLLGVMAIYYHQERIYGADASSYLFGLVNDEWFYTERGRIIIWLSQWLPLLAVWFGLSMKGVLIANSLGHVVFFYLIFLLAHFRYGKTHVGLLMLLTQLMAVSEAYFAWAYGEVYYGVGLVVLVTLLFEKGASVLSTYLLLAVLGVFLVTGHPLVLPVLGFALMVLIVDNGASKKIVAFGIAIVVSGVLRFFLSSSYDAGLAQSFFSASSLLPDIDEVFSFSKQYPLVCIGLTLSSVHLLLAQRFRSFLLFVLAGLLITIVISRYFPLDGATQQYYQSYAGLFVMYAYFELGDDRNRIIRTLILFVSILIMFFSVVRINQFGKQVVEHMTKLTALATDLQTKRGNRFIIDATNIYGYNEKVWMHSEPFYEMLLISADMPKTVLLRVFEWGMEYQARAVADVTALEGPDAGLNNDRSYPDTPNSRRELSNWLHKLDPTLNRNYFTVSEISDYSFLNNNSTVDLKYQKNQVELHVEELNKRHGYVKISIISKLDTLFSGYEDSLQLMAIGNGYSDTLIRPLTKDIETQSTEVISLNDWNLQEDLKLCLTWKGLPISSQVVGRNSRNQDTSVLSPQK